MPAIRPSKRKPAKAYDPARIIRVAYVARDRSSRGAVYGADDPGEAVRDFRRSPYHREHRITSVCTVRMVEGKRDRILERHEIPPLDDQTAGYMRVILRK